VRVVVGFIASLLFAGVMGRHRAPEASDRLEIARTAENIMTPEGLALSSG